MRIKIKNLQTKIKLCNISVIGNEEGNNLRPRGTIKRNNETNFNSIDESNGQVEDLFSLCPMLYIDNEGNYFCLNQDGFEEVNYFPLHFESLEVFQNYNLNDLTNEKNHSNFCFDICSKKRNNEQLFCFSKNSEIKTRKINLTVQKMNNMKKVLYLISDNDNSEVCRECLYKTFLYVQKRLT